MLLRIIATAILFLFSSLVYAIPFDAEDTPPNPNFISRCKDYVYINDTSVTSHSGKDCNNIVNNIQYGGLWIGSGHEREELARYPPCGFALELFENPSNKEFWVGNGDIVETIWYSIMNIEGDSPHIGVNGTMSCQRLDGGGYVDNVKWRIHGTI